MQLARDDWWICNVFLMRCYLIFNGRVTLKLFLYVLSLYLSVNIEYMFGYLYCLSSFLCDYFFIWKYNFIAVLSLMSDILWLIIITLRRWSYAIVTVCRSFVLLFCKKDNSQMRQAVNICRPNMVGIGDPLEVIKFWCQSESGCGLRLLFHFY